MSALRDDALATLAAWRPADDGQERLRHDFVAHLQAHVDGLSRSLQPAHLTAGALVFSADATRVLLTLHAKAGRWFHLGGHCEPGDGTLVGAALREATEESGISGLRLDTSAAEARPEPLHLDAHTVDFCGGRPEIRHLDVRYLALAPAGARPEVSEESLDVRWWPVDGLPTDEPGLHDMVALGLPRARRLLASAGRRSPGVDDRRLLRPADRRPDRPGPPGAGPQSPAGSPAGSSGAATTSPS